MFTDCNHPLTNKKISATRESVFTLHSPKSLQYFSSLKICEVLKYHTLVTTYPLPVPSRRKNETVMKYVHNADIKFIFFPVAGVQQNITAKHPDHLRQAGSPAYLTKHNGLTLPRQFPPEVSQTFTSSIHYSDWGRQVSSESSSPPLSASPVASPTDDRSPTHANVLEDRDIGVWKCGQCQERFTQRSALRLHVCPSQANNPFQCGHCSLSFADPTKLRAHVVTHNNERPFKCGFCSRTFAGATTLNNHVRTHTGQKPFTCEKCGKSFSQASQMSRHQRLAEDCQ